MKGTNSKQRILDVAGQLFHRQGYNSTGVNQIIAEAGIAKGSLYHLFKSKEALCVGYLNQRHDYWFGLLNAHISDAKGPKSKAIAAFDFIYGMNEKENFRGCSFLNILSEISAQDEAILTVIQNHKQDLRDFFKQTLPEELDDVIDHVYLLFESAIIESQLFHSQWPVEKAKKIIVSLLK